MKYFSQSRAKTFVVLLFLVTSFIFANEACKSNQPVAVPQIQKTKGGSQLIQEEDRLADIAVSILGVTLFIGGMILMGIAFGALRASLDSSSKTRRHHHYYYYRNRRTFHNRISTFVCPNSQPMECPDYLKNIVTVLNTCSLVDDNDLTYRLMRNNFDQAVLRETLLHNTLRNGSTTNTAIVEQYRRRIDDETFWRRLPPDFRFDEVLKVYNFQDISSAAAKVVAINFLCHEVNRGTFNEPDQTRLNLTTLTQDELEDVIKNTKKFGGVFQGYLDEDEFDPGNKAHMLKILKGNIKFFPGWKIDGRSSIEAPNLSSDPEYSDRICARCPPISSEQVKNSSPETVDAIINDITINFEIRAEIKQITPHIADHAKSTYLGIVRHQVREILTERKGAEQRTGTVEGINEDKLWPSDKYGFKFAYAIKVNRQKWRIKKPHGTYAWDTRPISWSPAQESDWYQDIRSTKERGQGKGSHLNTNWPRCGLIIQFLYILMNSQPISHV